MRRRPAAPVAAPVPFDPAAARYAREALGLSPAMVARAMAAHGVHPAPPQVIAWESGQLLPSETELTALARALWCLPGRLMGGRARSVRDHRLALDLPAEETARRLGLTPRVYAQLENEPRWTGDEDLTYLLAEVLRLGPYALVVATGRNEALQEALQRAVHGRWQPQARAVARLAPTLERAAIEHALRTLSSEGQASTALWGGDRQQDEEPPPGPEDLERRFWQLLGPAADAVV
ncbi:helix-turn-helix domain-containing protein [Streptacidiphilus cavernicola]|uniref:XRE family transcriptional regulator n=1 Tax=Streptacidiphilus cavernicola TaxID=3342716 RepID=A0ABV6W275_9ACTN